MMLLGVQRKEKISPSSTDGSILLFVNATSNHFYSKIKIKTKKQNVIVKK